MNDKEIALVGLIYKLTVYLRSCYGTDSFNLNAELVNELNHKVLGHFYRKNTGGKTFPDSSLIEVSIEYLKKIDVAHFQGAIAELERQNT